MDAYFLTGPTASGKTTVAHALARHHGYELLSADSMLIYRGMDIGTAKPTAEARAEVTYHGIDLVPVNTPFNAWQYHAHAVGVLTDLHQRGKRAIVVGGTGLYLKLLTHGLSDMPGPDPDARAHWERVLADEGVGALAAALQEKSPALYSAVDDPCNGRRLVRFLEWAAAGLTAPPRQWESCRASAPMPALRVDPEVLKSVIEQRVHAMYRQGLLEEVRGLLSVDDHWSRTARQAIGYAEAIDVIEERCTVDEAIARTAARTRQLAKRQRTWLRTQADVRWIDAGPSRSLDEQIAAVDAHWAEQGPTRIEVCSDDTGQHSVRH